NGKTGLAGELGTPLGNDPRVREALDLSIDREALNQVAWEGQYTIGCTPISPVSPFYDKSRKCPGRDVARAKKLLAEAGLAGGYGFELMIVNDPQQRRVGEVVQGMAREAGFNITLRPAEFASSLNDNEAGPDCLFCFKGTSWNWVLGFIVHRTAISAVTLLVISLIVVTGVRMIPGDPARVMAGTDADDAGLAEIREKYGLNDPVPLQYLR